MRVMVMILCLGIILHVVHVDREKVHVSRVIDGDTLVLRDGTKVRLLQINAPERGECGYEAAKEELKRLVEGRDVELEVDPEFGDTDKYGRKLRYVMVGTANVNVRMQQQGFVNTMFYEGHHGKYAYQMNGPGACNQ